MQINEFVEATSRLENYFDKEYTNSQRTIMFDELKVLDIDRYKHIIAVLIRNAKYLPKIADILEVNNTLARNKKNLKDEEIIECKYCDSKGFLLYKKYDSRNKLNYEFVCRCFCENGKKYMNFPQKSQVGI